MRRNTKYFFLVIIFILSSTFCFAQYGLPTELHFNKLSVKDGLPEGYVRSMIQDKEGYIWLSTQRGLVRFDGYQAKVYTLGIQDPFKMNVTKVYQDRKGRLWVGLLNSNSIYLFDRAKDRFIPCKIFSSASDSIRSGLVLNIYDDNKDRLWIEFYSLVDENYIYCLFYPETGKFEWYGKTESGKNYINARYFNEVYQDSNEHIWLCSSNGLYEFDENNQSFTAHLATSDSTKQIRFYNITKDNFHTGNFWLNSYNGNYIYKGLARFNTANDSAVFYYHDPRNRFSIASDSIRTIFNDSRKRLWIGTYKGLSLYNPVKNNFTNYYPKEKQLADYNSIKKILEDKAGNFWCQTGKGLLYFDTTIRRFTRISANPKQADGLISDKNIHTLMLDKNSNLWFGVQDLGVQWINRRRSGFIQYSNNSDALHYFPGGNVYNFTKASDGTVWIGAEHGLYHWQPKTNAFTSIKFWKDKAVQPSARSVMVDKSGKIWFRGQNNNEMSLDCYDPHSRKTIYYSYNQKDSSSLSNNNVHCIYQDHLGNIWVGTFGGGICELNPKTKKFTRYPYILNDLINSNNQDALDDDEVDIIFEDSKSTLWVGTNKGGLNRFNRQTGTFSSYAYKVPGFGCVIDIKEDSENNLWVGTYFGGVFRFNPKTTRVERFTEKNGLLYDGAFSILKDSVQNLWLTSYRGISIFNPQTGQVRNLTSASGLPGSNFWAGLKINNNRFLIGCDNGFISINPEDVSPETNAPVPHVESVTFIVPSVQPIKDSTIVAFGRKNISFLYNENRLTFSFVGLDYQQANLVQYACKLEGYDKDWIKNGKQRTAVYTNLSPGEYTFQIKTANSDGVWSKESAGLNITVLPPWWDTWWAYGFYFLFGFGLLYSIRKFELNQQRKNAEIKESRLRAEAAELQAKAADAQAKVIQVENDRKTKELEEARTLQLSMLPKELPQLSSLDIAVYMQTATEVGGDYYDFSTKEDDSLNVCLGDATGHGMKAGTIVSMMKSLFTGISIDKNIKDFFDTSNKALKNSKLDKMMMAFAMLNIDKNNKIQIANAGIPPVYIYRKRNNNIEEINLKGLPLGAMKNSKYEIYESELKPGDILLLLSDGLPELFNENKELFGYKRMKNVFEEVSGYTVEEIIKKLKDAGSEWVDGKDPDDDVTFVVIKVK